MGIPPEDLEGGSTSDYESFGDKVNVEVTDLFTYYWEMSRLSGEAMGAATNAMSEMNMMVHDGLSTPLEGEILPEGQSAARFLTNRISTFKAFVMDATTGVMNIGNAAVVVAEMYENSDNENGANLNDIGFVFGDTGAQGPGGFRDTETFRQYQQRMAEQSGQNAQALTSDERYARAASYPYGTIYTFGDGSTKMTYSGYEAGPNGTTVIVSTTSIYGPDGKLLSQTSKRTYQNMGIPTTVVSTTTGEGDQRQRSTTTTTENADGSVTVQNETQSGNDPAKTQAPVTVNRDSHNDGGVDAPVEDAAEDLGSDGGSEGTRIYGRA